MTQPIITVKDLSKSYASEGAGTNSVISGLNLSIPQGELTAFMGPSGSGKSTLLNLIGGLDRPSSGCVDVAGHPIHALGEKDLARFRFDSVGFVFQHFHLMPNFTVAENVALNDIIRDRPRSRWIDRVVELLHAVGLLDRIDSLPHTLSGGQQQRVAVCRALFHRPPLVLADEPTGNLDTKNSTGVLQMIRDAVSAGSGATGLLVTHDPEAAMIADRVLLLRDGGITGEFIPELRQRGVDEEVDDAERIRTWVERASR